MAKKLTVHVVLDRSGSMQSIKDDTIGAFNSYVSTLATGAPDSKLSLTIFDDQSIDTIVNDVKIGDVPPLTTTTFQPRGLTPLYDAIGKTVGLLDAAKGKHKVLVVLTDGQENASREHSKGAIRKLLDERQKESKWLVIYLGANQDAFAEGGAIGTQIGTTMNYAATGSGMRGSMAASANATVRYASTGNLKSAAFTDEERAEAAK